VLALLADGPLAGREIEVEEPRPTIELADESGGQRAGAGYVHRYRLAGVDIVPAQGDDDRRERVALYAHCPEDARSAVPRAA
jgi:hypothetical protein